MTAATATAAVNPLTMVISTRRLDDDSQVYARVVVVPPTGKARVLSTVFEDTSHAKVVLRAVASAVRYSGVERIPLTVVVPDRVIAALLTGTPAGANNIGRKVAGIQRMSVELGAQCSYVHGTLRSVLGQAADLIDVW